MTIAEIKAAYPELCERAMELQLEGRGPLETIKELQHIGNLDISTAKTIQLAACRNMSLDQHVEELLDDPGTR